MGVISHFGLLVQCCLGLTLFQCVLLSNFTSIVFLSMFIFSKSHMCLISQKDLDEYDKRRHFGVIDEKSMVKMEPNCAIGHILDQTEDRPRKQDPKVAPTSGRESESKSGEGNNKNPLKRSKGSLGSLNMLTGKDNETSKASGASNGGLSHSGESGGEDSSEGSDANSQNDSQRSGKSSADVGAQNGGTPCSVSSGVSQTFPNQAMVNPSMVMTVPPNSISGPTTNLNIGMDYWGGPTPPPVATGRAKLPTVQPPSAVVPSNLVGREGITSELWIQDERELKRQRRKQSNRESARRSRLRKQAEYDELAQRVESLKEDNGLLREELERMREECEKLTSENASLTEKLQKLANGQDSRANGVNGQPESDSKVAANINSTEKDC